MTTWLCFPAEENGKIVKGCTPKGMEFSPGDAPPHVIAEFFCALSDAHNVFNGHSLKFIALPEEEQAQ